MEIKNYGIYVDGARLDPELANIPSRDKWTAPDKIPAGCYLMMGDNRNDSRRLAHLGLRPAAGEFASGQLRAAKPRSRDTRSCSSGRSTAFASSGDAARTARADLLLRRRARCDQHRPKRRSGRRRRWTPAPSARTVIREYLDAFIVAGLVALFLITFVVRTFFIPSGSMVPTLQIHDVLAGQRIRVPLLEAARMKTSSSSRRRFPHRTISSSASSARRATRSRCTTAS